ncbi:MAG: Rieske (2Fe-2S) protein, partial [Pseudomonadales bacterium]|nr:Rieske (2Fe-2S) protein [Pseudomonadales bacterium]
MSQASKASGPVPFTKITADRYISPEYMVQERDKLWAKTWLVAGVTQDVAEPGDFFVFELEPESIIVSRAEDGTINAFYNVCQHRGARLLLTDQGAMATYTCPYHGWVYNNDGSLCEVPEEDRFSRGVPKEGLSLQTLRVDVWAGAVWVCM